MTGVLLDESNTDAVTLSKVKNPKLISNPLSKKTIGATLFSLIHIIIFLGWFTWAYLKYRDWYLYRVNGDNGGIIPTLPNTSIVKVGIPIFLLAIFCEWIVWAVKGETQQHYRAADTIASISNGLFQQLTEMWTTLIGEWFGLAMITAIPFQWIYDNYGLTRAFEGNWQGFVFMWFARDFGYYWFHRAAHRSAFMWAVHGVHHIPNSFSYHVNLCQGGIQRITSALFYAPLALICPPELYVIIYPMEKIYGFFTHTCMVANPYLLDYFFVTPSTHRVHHAGAPSIYIDKNYGEMLTIWDRLFGTHQDEQEPIVFGHVHPFDSWNPVYAQVYGWKKILEKTTMTNNIIDKLLCFVMPPGWNPVDGSEFPLSDEHPYSANKYDSDLPWILTIHLFVWFLPVLLLSIFIIKWYQFVSTDVLFMYFTYSIFSLASMGMLTDRNPKAIISEIIRLLLAPVVVYSLTVVGTVAPLQIRISDIWFMVVPVLSILSILVLLSNNHLFTVKANRYKNVWIKEAGRLFTYKLNKSDKSK